MYCSLTMNLKLSLSHFVMKTQVMGKFTRDRDFGDHLNMDMRAKVNLIDIREPFVR